MTFVSNERCNSHNFFTPNKQIPTHVRIGRAGGVIIEPKCHDLTTSGLTYSHQDQDLPPVRVSPFWPFGWPIFITDRPTYYSLLLLDRRQASVPLPNHTIRTLTGLALS